MVTTNGDFHNNEKLQNALSEKDIRFTQNNGKLYAFVLGFPSTKEVVIKALGKKSPQMNGKRVKNVRMLGVSQKVGFKQTNENLTITMPNVENTGKTICFEIK